MATEDVTLNNHRKPPNPPAWQCVWDILERANASQGETENALCAITVVELTHGIYRAKSEVDQSNHAARTEYRQFLPLCQNADMRRRFTDECCQRTQPAVIIRNTSERKPVLSTKLKDKKRCLVAHSQDFRLSSSLAR
jgi:hypothetical protein